jgi:hypothetical protein
MHTPIERRSLTELSILLAALMGTVGCSNEPRKYPVHGVVRFRDGKVLQKGSVEFEGGSDDERIVARGPISEDGSFTLGTDTADDGVVEGVYRAVVISDDAIGTGVERPGLIEPARLHRKYRQFESSDLEFTVEPKVNEIVIEVEYSPEVKPGS